MKISNMHCRMENGAFVERFLYPSKITAKRSCFLFGPRQTGKSTLIRNTLPGAIVYNLLDSKTFFPLSRQPSLLRQQVERGSLVVIDEIQKLPGLLDEVHLLIEERGVRFLLTGSSARKLRRGGVNLLGGRARSRILHPLSWGELRDRFDLRRGLSRGLLPSIYFSDAPYEDLDAYVGDYLQQEISAEGATRNVPAFGRVLQEAARYHGGLINYAKVSQQAHVPASTVREYFQILKDTLIVHELPAYRATKKRDALSTAKLYFFDLGVANRLLGRRNLSPRSPEFGFAFETFIFHELRAFLDYRHPTAALHHWRSRSGFEVDFIIDEAVAVEVKAKQRKHPVRCTW
jgi:predicted AAA+ superfamily ATPase